MNFLNRKKRNYYYFHSLCVVCRYQQQSTFTIRTIAAIHPPFFQISLRWENWCSVRKCNNEIEFSLKNEKNFEFWIVCLLNWGLQSVGNDVQFRCLAKAIVYVVIYSSSFNLKTSYWNSMERKMKEAKKEEEKSKKRSQVLVNNAVNVNFLQHENRDHVYFVFLFWLLPFVLLTITIKSRRASIGVTTIHYNHFAYVRYFLSFSVRLLLFHLVFDMEFKFYFRSFGI